MQTLTAMLVVVVVLVGLKASRDGWGFGYFTLGSAIVVAAAGYWIASVLPRSWRPWCRACGWRAEIPCK